MTERTKRMLNELNERAKRPFDQMIFLLDDRLGDDQYIVFEGIRKPEVQIAYYAQGRENLEEVNKKRTAAGLWLLRSEKDNYIITQTPDKSKHIEGLAMDIVPVDGRGNPTWDLSHYRRQFGVIIHCGREVPGIIVGADWSPWPDLPHYEVK